MLLVFFVVAFVVTAGAQPVATGAISNVTRVESWSYFQPFVDRRASSDVAQDKPPPRSDPLGNPNYTFVGDRAELGVRVAGSRFDLGGAFSYVRLENLPTRAIGPGGLGAGAFYFAATGVRYSYQLYLGELTVKMKSATGGAAVTLGRMPFASGGEYVGTSPSLERLKSERLHSRLIGNFEWSFYQRRFDGARIDIDRTRWHVTASAFVPTQGGYEESTNLSMPKVQVATASITRKEGTLTASSARSTAQAFAYIYRDRRGEAATVDNMFSLNRRVNITIATLGGSHARLTPTRAGEIDTVAWAAVQTGDWYGQHHQAASVAIEAGHRWTAPSYRPWVRAGYLWASGDRSAEDDRHGTFFQMLPSSRKYALSSVYTQMNLSDAFAQLQIEPRWLLARIELHALHLASGADLWYQGSGATANRGRFFGFSGRIAHPSTALRTSGPVALGSVLEGTIDVPIRTFWSINGYAGVMSAGAAVRPQFTSKPLTLWAVENVIRF